MCTNAPVGIMELAKSDMRAKVQLQIQKGKGSQKPEGAEEETESEQLVQSKSQEGVRSYQ